MNLPHLLVERFLGLPRAETRDLIVERNLPVPMPDGAVLLATRFAPRAAGRFPTVLLRSPYGRDNIYGMLFGLTYAGRGFQVLIQSCRGTFGSGGQFNPLRHEQADGLATLDWLRRQPWFSGELVTAGQSYLGFVQWAIAAQAGSLLKAMVPMITASEFRSMTYAGESFALDTVLSWVTLVTHQEKSPLRALAGRFIRANGLNSAFMHLPLAETDRLAASQRVPFFQDWLVHERSGDDWWRPVDFSAGLGQAAAPAHLIGGWYDIFLPRQLADYAALRQAGRQPYLTIGPWAHTSPGLLPVCLRESLAWFRAHLLGDRSGLRARPVRVFVLGSGRWVEFDEWPPAGSAPQRWHLQPGGGLSTAAPVPAGPSRYRYDPTNPTPAVGGSSLSQNSGPRDNRALEARPDVLTFSSAPLERDLAAAGPLQVELYVRSSLAYTDFFARLCDVSPSGRSTNLSDGLLRLEPGRPAPQPDGTLRIALDLWPTASLFRRGHRLRLQISSGAHPRFARNPGSGEPLAAAVRLQAADQAIFHDPDHPSALILPVLETE